jgi:hypothetical protein
MIIKIVKLLYATYFSFGRKYYFGYRSKSQSGSELNLDLDTKFNNGSSINVDNLGS